MIQVYLTKVWYMCTVLQSGTGVLQYYRVIQVYSTTEWYMCKVLQSGTGVQYYRVVQV